jgi:glucose/arabinose dehydrogenase
MAGPPAEPKGMRTLGPLALAFSLLAAPAAPAGAELLELLTDEAAQPIYLTHAGDDRLFIVERQGAVRVFQNGALLPDPFLDISSRVDGSGEGGLLSIAFHPDYATNGAFYVSYTTDDPDTGFTSVISRFHVSAGDPNVADPAEDVLLENEQPFTNHNGGQIAFGPDDMLYVGFGDGGDANDPGCRAQRTDTWHGKLLRLEVDPTGTAAPFYTIPADNPFDAPADGILDEIWDLGLRNPWRFSFDREEDHLWIGDVGQGSVEEVDLEAFPSAGGFNYGWKVMEGNFCANPGADNCPGSVPGCDAAAYTPPIDQYAHQAGNRSITGGYVYRGVQAPGFAGNYVFGDYGSGRIFVLREVSPGQWQRSTILAGGASWASFGEGADGELYALDLPGGNVYRLDLTAAISAADRACILGLNGRFAKLAKARAGQLARCVSRAAAGKLPGGPEACAAADDPKVQKQAAKTLAVEAAECELLPPFGATSAATVNAAAAGAELDLLHDVLGDDLDAAVVAKATDAAGARCQAKVAAQLQRCQGQRVKEFLRCKKAGLRDGTVEDDASLAACLGADPKGKVAGQCDDATGALASKVLPSACAGVALDTRFPGCGAADAAGLAACAERAGRCRACLALDAADGLGTDCDAFDDGQSNASCS